METRELQNLNFNNFEIMKINSILIKVIFISTLMISIVACYGQNKNIFLERSFWKKKPSIEKIDSCISKGNDVSALNKYAFDPVTWAIIEKNSNEIVKYLISKEGNGVNKLTHDGRTYIFWAMYRNNLQLMEYLFDKGARLNIIDSHGYSLINFGAVTGQTNIDLYRFCIENGVDVKTQLNNIGANPLLLVSSFLKNDSLLNYFISLGIDINDCDNEGNGIFNYTAKKGNQEMMNLLIQKGVDYKNLNKINGNAMIFASYGTRSSSNNLETYKYLENLGIEPNITTNKGVNPLHSIAYKIKDLDIFNYFISKGVDVNQLNIDGQNVFMNSCYSNDTSVISLLLKYTNNINEKNKKGKSSMTIAVEFNNLETIKFLVKNGADVTLKDEKGNNLMYYLIKNYSTSKKDLIDEKINYLINEGLNPSENQENGKTILHLAVENGTIGLIEKIFSFGVDINAVTKDNLTALHIAASKAKDLTVLNWLIKNGANKNLKSSFGETAFDLANENEILTNKKINIDFLKNLNE